jgi:Ser/Thr protein kinase RdoA (MazF antagonist)
MESEILFNEAVEKFLAKGDYHFSPTIGGVNNIVKHLEDNMGKHFILRLYNNGNDSNRVKFEHEVLSHLKEMDFPFEIPSPLPCKDGTNATHAVLSNGAEASLFHVIPGSLPKLTAVREIGVASGILNSAMATIWLSTAPPNPPYYDLYRVHHAVTRELFFDMIRSESFDSVRAATDELCREIVVLEELISKLLSLNLPQQLIHGDLHYDNVLVHHDGQVSGLLDFEFCAMDWRAMELAICLSKYAGENNALGYFADFIDGYMQHAVLTPIEVEVVPDLINLRILSNVVYFVGRAIAKEDSISTITKKAETYLTRINWIKSNRRNIMTLIEKCIR